MAQLILPTRNCHPTIRPVIMFLPTIAAGARHTVLLTSDGHMVACGDNRNGVCDPPSPANGVAYVQVAAGHLFTVLVRSDGEAVACGCDGSLPILENGVAYTQAAARSDFIVLLRSDGGVVTCGAYHHDRSSTPHLCLPVPENGVAYTRVGATGRDAVMLRSDGLVATCGVDRRSVVRGFGQVTDNALQELPEKGFAYTQFAGGGSHWVLLSCDGRAWACGMNTSGQCDLPELQNGATYTQVAAGEFHTVLLRSDGHAVACGENEFGQCDIPTLENGASYIQVAGGDLHTVLLRSDGRAVACGDNAWGQCRLPVLEEGQTYGPAPCLVLTIYAEHLSKRRRLRCKQSGGTRVDVVRCVTLAGNEVASLRVDPTMTGGALRVAIMKVLPPSQRGKVVSLVLPSGRLLADHQGALAELASW